MRTAQNEESFRSVELKVAGCVLLFLVSGLVGGNIFFIKRLVDKIESTELMVWSLRQDVVLLKYSVEHLLGITKMNNDKNKEG